MKLKKLNIKKGFTLVEIVVAIGLVSLLLSGVLGLMGVSAQKIDKSLAKTDAKNALDAFVAEMAVLRAGESYATPYDKASDFCGNGVYVYRANVKLDQLAADGSRDVYKYSDLVGDHGANPVIGVDYAEEYRIRPEGSVLAENETDDGIVSGNIYFIRFRGYTVNSTGDLDLDPLSSYGGVHPDGVAGGTLDTSVIFNVQAEVYKNVGVGVDVDSRLADYVDQSGKLRPIFKANLAFRR